MIFKQQLTDISTVLNNTGNTTKLLTSFNALDIAQQKVLLSSSLLSEKQKEQCITMATLSAANTKYTAEQLAKATGISTETLANWGLIESTDALTISELAQRAASDAQAKAVLDKIIAQNAEAVANGKIIASNTALTASEGGATLATGAFTTAIKANIKAMITWMTTTPLGWLTMLVGGVFLAVKAYDALTVSVKEQKEKMEDSLSAYKDAKSELSNITTELENQEQAMDDLLAKEKLTYAEQGQLEELQAITRELRIQKDLAEKEEGRTQKEVAKDASDLFNKQFGKYDISEDAISEYQNNANITGNNAILISDENDISSMIAGYRQFNNLLDEAYGSESQEDIDHFKSLTEDLKDSIFETAQELQEQQSNIADYYNTIKDIPYDDLTTEQKGIVDSYNSISDAIGLIYQQLDSNTWKSMQIESVFDTEGIEKTKEELIEMVKAGEFDESTLQSYPKLSEALEQNKVSASELRNELEALVDAEGNVKGNTFNDKYPTSFNTEDYEETIDSIQESISTLRSALDSLNSGELSKIEVVDLMQQFPDLVPYIDLTADGFGNLSEGLSTLIEQQPDSLIQSLQDLKQSLSTDEEREQVDLLINSLQRLSSYGDTGIEAYSTSIGNTWNDTANVIENVTNQFENLAKVQEAVANGLTMSTTAAAELAKMYPEILTNAEVSANGQITLNEGVVSSILDGDKSIIDAQIAKLEADKAELTSKKSYAEAQLNIVKQVAEGEGNITREVAKYRLDIANQLLQSLIEAGMEEDRAYAAVAENMAGNMEEYNRIVGEVAQDTSVNMDAAAVSMANSININSINAQNSFKSIQDSVWKLADSIKGAANGERTGSAISSSGGGSTSTGGIKARKHNGNFNTAITDYTPQNLNLKDFQSQLEVDIKGYTDAIANIDSQIAILKNLQASFDKNGGIGGHGYKDKIKQLEKEKDALNKATKDSSNSAKDEFNDEVDFFERRVKVLQNAFENLEKGMSNVFGADAKNTLVTAQIGIVDEQINNYTDALAMYRQKANDALSGVSADLRDKIVNGAVQITDFVGKGNEEVIEAIENYQGWADKVADCTQKLEELKTQIRQLELQKFNNIMEEFNNQFNIRDDSIDLIKKQIGLLEEAGELIGESFYSKQIEQSQKKLDALESERVRLVQQLNDAISSGRIQHGTDEWLEMQNALSEVEGDILDCKTAMEEFSNELLNLNWQIFERVQTEFGNISSELGNLADLFDNVNDIRVSDGEGTWTNQAIATLGLYAQQLELAKYQVGQYGNAIENLNKDYLAGKYSATEYMEKLADLSQGQWDAVKSAESLEDAIFDLNKTRVDEEIEVIEDAIDAYKEYTDAQIEALDAAKDLHDYQKEIADKTKSVADLERQIAAMQNDNSIATIAKRKKLEEQLAEAKQDLAESEYNHSIESQKEALNKNLEDFENARNAEIELLKASLENRELLISDSLETVKVNASLVGQEIANIATEHGVIVSDVIISSWKSGENAIASYGAVLSEQSSAFIGNLIGVQSYVCRIRQMLQLILLHGCLALGQIIWYNS